MIEKFYHNKSHFTLYVLPKIHKDVLEEYSKNPVLDPLIYKPFPPYTIIDIYKPSIVLNHRKFLLIDENYYIPIECDKEKAPKITYKNEDKFVHKINLNNYLIIFLFLFVCYNNHLYRLYFGLICTFLIFVKLGIFGFILRNYTNNRWVYITEVKVFGLNIIINS